MANQDIIGTTNCACCGALVNLKRNKNGKAYYFCHGELETRMCKNPQGGMNADLSRRIISIAAKHGEKPHFTKIGMTADNEPIVEIEQEEKEAEENGKNNNPDDKATDEKNDIDRGRGADGRNDTELGKSSSKSEWPYV